MPQDSFALCWGSDASRQARQLRLGQSRTISAPSSSPYPPLPFVSTLLPASPSSVHPFPSMACLLTRLRMLDCPERWVPAQVRDQISYAAKEPSRCDDVPVRWSIAMAPQPILRASSGQGYRPCVGRLIVRDWKRTLAVVANRLV